MSCPKLLSHRQVIDLAWLVNDFYSGYSYLSQLKVEHEEIMLALK